MSKKQTSSESKKKHYKKVPAAKIRINCSMNNTMITVSDTEGNKLFQMSPSVLGYKGPKKPTAYAAQAAVHETIKRLDNYKTTSVEVEISGVGSAREAALRSMIGKVSVTKVSDCTPIVHNGTRPPGAKSL